MNRHTKAALAIAFVNFLVFIPILPPDPGTTILVNGPSILIALGAYWWGIRIGRTSDQAATVPR